MKIAQRDTRAIILPWPHFFVFALVLLLFLGSYGFLSVDEPRYAEMGRQMWRSGDWVTPLLWGEKFLEKPPLPFWATAAMFTIGLRDEWAARLPVALFSLGFLALFYRRLRDEFDHETALLAAVILVSTPGWFVYSRLAVFDLPLAAFFGAAMLYAMPWALRGERAGLDWFGVFMGLAMLTKALVPVALALPLLWWSRRRLLDLVRPALIALAIAAPWFVLCYQRNGRAMIDELFIRHHVARFFNASADVLHPQPFWFYVPVMLAGLWSWAPALVPAFRDGAWKTDARLRYFAVWAGFGLLFFSASGGKLPGYVLPLVPPIAVLCAAGLLRLSDPRRYFTAAILLAALLVPVAVVAQDAIKFGLLRALRSGLPSMPALSLMLLVAISLRAFRASHYAAQQVMVLVFVSMMVAVSGKDLSARGNALLGKAGESCYGEIHRRWAYGLNYYAGHAIPNCVEKPARYLVKSQGPEHELEVMDAARSR